MSVLSLLSGALGLTAPYAQFTGKCLERLSKTPMFRMFSTAPASIMINVYKRFTGKKSDHPMFIRSLRVYESRPPRVWQRCPSSKSYSYSIILIAVVLVARASRITHLPRRSHLSRRSQVEMEKAGHVSPSRHQTAPKGTNN